MQPSASSSPVQSAATDYEEKIRHLPPAAQVAFRRFRTTGDVTVLDPVVYAILENFVPRTPPQPLAEMPAGSQLIEDLGFDSLAITEVVFFSEDLFGIHISNEEIFQVRTLDDLRVFVRRKVEARAAR
ncbi:MAG TPA: acyl carrier protein [Candidatus Didemnitutus sp.]|nr:acyl carrier protein [Candidatus Didemnitutus sp.]